MDPRLKIRAKTIKLLEVDLDGMSHDTDLTMTSWI
jgi:hypothetical protein